jgi:tetratricopeptide (TPR) repeat protein
MPGFLACLLTDFPAGPRRARLQFLLQTRLRDILMKAGNVSYGLRRSEQRFEGARLVDPRGRGLWDDVTPSPDVDSLWNYSDPVGSEARFKELLPHIDPLTDPSTAAEVLSQIARAQGFQQQFAEAKDTLHLTVPMWSRLSSRAQCRVLLEAGRLEHSSEDSGSGEDLFLAALSLADHAGEEALAIDAAHMLAIVTHGESQTTWGIWAIERAEHSLNQKAYRWLGTLYGNLGCSYLDVGRLDDAMKMFHAAEKWSKAHGRAEQHRKARWRVGRCERLLGDIDSAFATQSELMREGEIVGDEDGYVFKELGELSLIRGEPAEAALMFHRALSIFSRDPWRLTQKDTEELIRLEAYAEAMRNPAGTFNG